MQIGAIVLALAALFSVAVAGDAADSSELAASAQQHLNAGLYDDAARDYARLMDVSPADPAAYYGRVRALFEAHHSKEAFAAADLAQQNVPNTAPAEAAAGLAEFRRGELVRAEKHFLAAQKLDPQSAAALSGLARIYSTVSLFRRAREMRAAAHRADPGDAGHALEWASTLAGSQHLDALEKVLPLLDPRTEAAQNLRAHIAADKAAGDRKLRRLVSPYVSSSIKLVRIMDGPNRKRGFGVQVRLNDRTNVKLLLDTGASGIAIAPKSAERAGLEVLNEEGTSARGIGDRTAESSLTYLAAELRAGSVVFADYPIHVFRAARSADFDGLIGADVFQRFLVGIDFFNAEMQLEPRPGETEKMAADPPDRRDKPDAGFFRIYRFGNHLVVPAMINDKRIALFLIDSGSTVNLIDAQIAREFTGVSKDSLSEIRGIQGKVEQVSRAERISLTFAGFRQENPDLLAISLEKMDDAMGVGLSGVLGMPVLEQMKLTIDYREGTIRLEYKKKL